MGWYGNDIEESTNSFQNIQSARGNKVGKQKIYVHVPAKQKIYVHESGGSQQETGGAESTVITLGAS